jgi:hypothetical protein
MPEFYCCLPKLQAASDGNLRTDPLKERRIPFGPKVQKNGIGKRMLGMGILEMLFPIPPPIILPNPPKVCGQISSV